MRENKERKKQKSPVLAGYKLTTSESGVMSSTTALWTTVTLISYFNNPELDDLCQIFLQEFIGDLRSSYL